MLILLYIIGMLCYATIAWSGDTPDWVLEEYDQEVILSYLLKHDAGERLSITCNKKTGIVEVDLNVGVQGFKKGDTALMTLSGPGGQATIAAIATLESDKLAYMMGSTHDSRAVISSLSKAGILRIAVDGKISTDIRIGPQAARALGLYKKRCPLPNHLDAPALRLSR